MTIFEEIYLIKSNLQQIFSLFHREELLNFNRESEKESFIVK